MRRKYLIGLCLACFVMLFASCEKDEPKNKEVELTPSMWRGEAYMRDHNKEWFLDYNLEIFFKQGGVLDALIFNGRDGGTAASWESTPYTYKNGEFRIHRENYAVGYGWLSRSFYVAEARKDYMVLLMDGGTKKLILYRRTKDPFPMPRE